MDSTAGRSVLDEAAAEAARAAARPLARRLELDRELRPYAERRWRGNAKGWPVLHLEDVSGIPFVSVVPGVEEYQHRARVRAATGDLFAAVTAPSEGYEAYCRERLGLGEPELVLASPGEHRFAVARACAEGRAFREIVARARRAGGLVIHPYMAIESVWELARSVAQAAGVPVRVLGPPPPVLWIANDKALFSELVTRVLSAEWIVETRTARDPAEMAAHLRRMAEQHRTAGLKRTRCASAMGNAVYDLERIGRMPPEEILREVRAFLERTEWALDEEVLVVAWERTDDSPSTQLWIPPREEGLPIVEGVYEQLLEGDEKVFLGSRPSLFPAAVNLELTRASLTVATALQSLGYVGRCSFDFIVVPDAQREFRIRFTECNGRWGGTSTPMRLVDRLFPQSRPCYWAQDFMHRGLVGTRFGEVASCLEELLFDRATGEGAFVLYNVGPLARTGKFDVIALGRTPEEVEERARVDLPRRLGLPTG